MPWRAGIHEAFRSGSHLMTTGHKLATTDAGALDVLGSINDALLYDDLIGSSHELEVTGQRVRVLSLRCLVELKRALARPKDLAMLPVLEATLREREG
jgi:predicted nucleotidyltransferase